MSQSHPKPAAEVRDGNIKLAIWRNQSEKGAFYSVEPSRTYTDNNNQAKSSSSFSGTDLFKLKRLCDKAYDTIQELRAQDKSSVDDSTE